MPIVINTNVSSLGVQNYLNKAAAAMNKSLTRLSSGLRINSAADDPAGLFMASSMNSKMRGMRVAQQNVAMASNMVNTAVGDITAISNQVERIKELATQYANSTLSTNEQNAIKEEVTQRIEEINRIAKDSKFNELNLLDGSHSSGVRIQIGAGSDAATNSIKIEDVFDAADAKSIGLIGSGLTYTTVNAAFANATTAAAFIEVASDTLDTLAQRVSSAGAYQSRLESVSNSLAVQYENLYSSYSTVVDADVAAETSGYVKNQLLMQTASSMLVQANQMNGAIALSLVSSL